MRVLRGGPSDLGSRMFDITRSTGYVHVGFAHGIPWSVYTLVPPPIGHSPVSSLDEFDSAMRVFFLF
jgi:hypothetical protein